MITVSLRCATRLGVLGLGLAVPACREANTFVPPPPPAVTVAHPVRQEVVTHMEFTGRTVPYEAVEIRARVSGFLEKIVFEEGTKVAVGDPLYEIERAPYEAALGAARAELERAEARVAETQFDLEKVKDLSTRGVTSQQELVIAQANYDSAVATKLAAESQVKLAELNLGYTRIAAPIAGRINESRVDPGNLVGQGDPTLLSTIVCWDPIHVYFTVGERDALRLRREAVQRGHRQRDELPIYIRLADGIEYTRAGRVDYVDNRIDPDTGTIGVRAVFENPDELLIPGVFVRVRIPNPAREALLVPEVALQRDLSGYYLLVVDTAGMVERRNVEVAELLGTARVVTAGLDDEERVIVNGLQRARPGIKVDAQATTFEPRLGGPSAAPASAPNSAADAAAAGGA